MKNEHQACIASEDATKRDEAVGAGQILLLRGVHENHGTYGAREKQQFANALDRVLAKALRT